MQSSKDVYPKAQETRSCFVILSLKENVVEDIAQCEDPLELARLIHNH